MARNSAVAVGEAIRRAREQHGFTQEELAGLLGKTQAAISFWEKGRRTPDFHDLVALRIHVGLRLDELADVAEPAQREPVRALFRAQARRVLEDEFADTLDRLLEEAESEAAPETEIRVTSEDPVRAAQELLVKARIKKPPVPVAQLAERCGASVHRLEGNVGISGLLVALESGALIGYADEHEQRTRFTIAHELGHLLLRHYEHFHIDPRDAVTEGDPPDYDWRDERAANDFAAELLMPGAWIAQHYQQTPNLTRLANTFKVSRQAMQYRLANLGLS
jgi:transcriptional regulator with XRE-family HTH domain